MKLYRYNDAVAKQSFKDYKEDLSTGLANLVTFYNPDVIALGGGLSQASELFEGLYSFYNYIRICMYIHIILLCIHIRIRIK